MKKLTFKIILLALCFSVAAACGAEAKAPVKTEKVKRSTEIADPLEPINRLIFGINDILDKILIEPVAKTYKAIVPTPARNGVQNFIRNLETPLIVANSLLQGKFGDAGVATARFFINTTVGIGGLVDVAKSSGLTYKSEDFGQTLATWGFGDGFYIVLPILGPSSFRDGIGLAADTYADPVRIIADNTGKEWIYYTRAGLEGVDYRSRMITAIDDLRRNSLDYYAAARSAYGQKRASLIDDEGEGDGASAGSAPVIDYYAPQ